MFHLKAILNTIERKKQFRYQQSTTLLKLLEKSIVYVTLGH